MGALVFHTVALTNEFEGHFHCTGGAAVKMTEPKRCYSTITFNSSVQKDPNLDRFKTDRHVEVLTVIVNELLSNREPYTDPRH